MKQLCRPLKKTANVAECRPSGSVCVWCKQAALSLSAQAYLSHDSRGLWLVGWLTEQSQQRAKPAMPATLTSRVRGKFS